MPDHEATGRGPDNLRTPLVAIGASTGGPGALAEALAPLPEDFLAAVVAIQHSDGRDRRDLAQWLDSRIALNARVAEQGERPLPGTVLLPGDSQHMLMTDCLSLAYVNVPGETYCPSIDVFFRSVARYWPGPVVGVLLTGMGCDGAEGLRQLRRVGCRTVVQDPATSVAPDMPRAALELDGGHKALPLAGISASICALGVRTPG